MKVSLRRSLEYVSLWWTNPRTTFKAAPAPVQVQKCFFYSASDREAERQAGDVVPPIPGGGQGPARRGFLHGLPLLHLQRSQAAPHLTPPAVQPVVPGQSKWTTHRGDQGVLSSKAAFQRSVRSSNNRSSPGQHSWTFPSDMRVCVCVGTAETRTTSAPPDGTHFGTSNTKMMSSIVLI